MQKVLTPSFFNRPTVAVARALIGKYLVRRYRGKSLALMITEVEAYDGPRDKASHASRGRTPRNYLMFGEAGRFYVYFTYGMHWLANIVTGPREYPAAVLFRAGVFHPDAPSPKIPQPEKNLHLINGPARLTKFLHISDAQNGLRASKRSGLWLEDRGMIVPHAAIVARKRIGVEYAGKIWADKKYNFSISSPARAYSRVSRPRNRTR